MSTVEAATRPAGPTSDHRRRLGLACALVLSVVGLAMMAAPVSTPVPFLGWYLLSSVAVAVVVAAYRPRKALAVALVLGVVVLALGFWGRADPDLDPFHRRHDGGVVATEAAARMVLDGRNPYSADFSDALSPHHGDLDAIDDKGFVNPLVEHYPYLPVAFLVHAPLVELGDALGGAYDARLLYVALVAAALVVVASGDRPVWARAAAALAMTSNAAVAVYLPWGANDSAAAAAVVVALLVGGRRPFAGGLLLALGISLKALLVVVLVPLLALWMVERSRRLGRSLLVCLVALLVTCLPYLVADPSSFLTDTVAFNLGETELNYPTSGIGLGAVFHDSLSGGVLLVLSAVLVAVASMAAVAAVRRAPAPEVVLLGAGLIVFAGLVPARSFQLSYTALLVLLWAPIWRLAGARWRGLDGRLTVPSTSA